MDKIKRYLPAIILVAVSTLIVGTIFILDTSKNSPKVVVDESGNEYTLGISGSGQPTRSINVGDKAPDFTLTTFDRIIVKLSDLYKEKPVIVQFWATWCHICEREFPENNTFAQNNRDKFYFVAVNWGESSGQVEAYIRRKNLDPTAIKFLMNETSDVVRAYGIRGTPTHTVIDRDGKIAFYNIGYTSVEQFGSIIDSL